MSPQHFLEMTSFTFNLIGIVVCIAGLTLAHRTRHRIPGYFLAGMGFVIAAIPHFYPLFVSPH